MRTIILIAAFYALCGICYGAVLQQSHTAQRTNTFEPDTPINPEIAQDFVQWWLAIPLLEEVRWTTPETRGEAYEFAKVRRRFTNVASERLYSKPVREADGTYRFVVVDVPIVYNGPKTLIMNLCVSKDKEGYRILHAHAL